MDAPQAPASPFVHAALLACFLAPGTRVGTGSVPVLAPKLQPAVDQNILPGAVLFVAHKDRVLHSEAVGYSEVVTQKPMQPDALFWISAKTRSASKPGR